MITALPNFCSPGPPEENVSWQRRMQCRGPLTLLEGWRTPGLASWWIWTKSRFGGMSLGNSTHAWMSYYIFFIFFFNKESGRSQLLPGCILCFLEELSRKAKLSVWERTQASEFGWHGSKLWPCHLLGVWPREHIALRASKKTQIIIPTHRMQIKWENSEFPTRLWALFSQCWTHVLLYCKSNINVYLLCLQSYRSLFTEWLPCRGQC